MEVLILLAFDMSNLRFSVTLCTDSIVMSLTSKEVLMEIEKLDIFCDHEKIFRFQVSLFL